MVQKQRDASIDRNDEYEKFITTLREYHQKRGTVFEENPKVGPLHVDLLTLYKRVLEEGGYDRASDTRANKLAWGNIAQEFMPNNANVVSCAFLLKDTYYKNLAAYEISEYWKETPPPKEILEDVTAGGGDLRTRTLENYAPREARVQHIHADGEGSEGSENDQETPKNGAHKMDAEDPSSGRVTRGLRQAPPQRVLFGQSVDSHGRNPKSTGNANSPTPGEGANGAYGANSAAMTISNYEPRTIIPSTVKPVWTPAGQPQHFRDLAKKMLANRRSARPSGHVRGQPMLPGTGFPGANIYMRALFALQSGVPAEIRYALHHLVKISHERGDKYMFDQFPGLAEALIEQVLQASTLFCHVQWRISYEDDRSTEDDVLNAINGTPDLLKKIRSHTAVDHADGLQTEELATAMSNINEAGLVLRNMVLLDQNAIYLIRSPLIRDVLVVLLNLPLQPALIELRHYALDICEHVMKYINPKGDDPLYASLLAQLETADRGAIITTLRALSRIALNYETPNRLPNLPQKTLQRITEWLLIDDDELRSACLEFLYQYTALTDNVESMLSSLDMPSLVGQLVRLLMHGAQPDKEREQKRYAHPQTEHIPATSPPKLSQKIIESLIAAIPDERELGSAWLRTCFEEDIQGEITQLALWSAYNEAFVQAKLTRPLMQAKDFITNVSNTFTKAHAQVVYTDPDPSRPKYTVRGVRPRSVPVDLRGRPYLKCSWRTTQLVNSNTPFSPHRAGLHEKQCDFSAVGAEEMWEHVLGSHFNLLKNAGTGRYNLQNPQLKQDHKHTNGDVPMNNDVNPTNSSPAPERWSCHWGGCRRFSEVDDLGAVVRHVATHLPDTSLQAPIHKVHNVPDGRVELPPARALYSWNNTPVDERGDATGLPLASFLVLRNLARQIGKVDEAEKVRGGRTDGWMELVFGEWRERIAWVGSVNRSVKGLMGSLEYLVEKGLGLPELKSLGPVGEEGHY